MFEQTSLFPEDSSAPEGFRYQADLMSPEQEAELLGEIRQLPFKEFEFHGFLGKRRVVSFGWRYDYAREAIARSEEIPPFLGSVRELAAQFAGLGPEDLQQVLVTEYEPGAGIGWHRDKRVFGEVIGISLLSACVFRLRRPSRGGWERYRVVAEPRSAYLLSGPSRTEWEHSLPPVDALRYSITFRNFARRSPSAHSS